MTEVFHCKLRFHAPAYPYAHIPENKNDAEKITAGAPKHLLLAYILLINIIDRNKRTINIIVFLDYRLV